jgi:YVTN family beta-propeller protein
VTNKVYVANNGSNNITVIDGATNATTTLTDQTASGPTGVAVDALTNQIYVTNNASATVTVIDGATNALTSVTLPNASGTGPIDLDPLTDTVYALNTASNNVSVIAGVAGTGAPDFAMGMTSAGLTLSAGGQATDTIIVGPPYGSSVNLSCSVSGPSPAPTCELSATSVTPGPTYGTATLTIAAPAAAAMQAPSKGLHLNRLTYAAWLPLAFGITLAGASKWRRGDLLLGGFLLLLILSQLACGGGASASGGNPGPTNYTVTVTGTSGAIQHTTQVTVTVE